MSACASSAAGAAASCGRVNPVMATLVLTLPNGETEPMELGRDRYTIGRSRTCDIRLSDPKVSRVHAELVRAPGGIWKLRDAGSANHTYVNGRPVTEYELQDGDALQVGPALFHFRDGGSTTTRLALSMVDDHQAMAGQALVGSPSGRFALNEARLRTMYDLLSKLTVAGVRGDVLQEVMELAAKAVDAERGFIGLQEPRKNLEVMAQVRMDVAGTVPVSRSMLHQAAGLGNTLLYPNPKSNLGLNEHSISTLNIHSAVAAPISIQNRPSGVLYLDRIKSFRPFTPDDLDFAVAVAREIGVWEENRRLMDAERKRLELESRLLMARRVQQDLFPAYPPEYRGYKIHAHNIPCTDASGDTYDVIDLGDGRLAISIGDVAGKGIGAAMLASNIQASFRTAVRAVRNEPEINLARVIETVNEVVSAGLANIKFVTFLAAVLDTKSGLLTYVNAGHNYPVLVHGDGRVEQLRNGHNTILGIPDSEAFEQAVCRFPADSALVLYTDGIVEALNAQSAQFTYERFAETLRRTAGRPAAAIVDVVAEAVEEFVGDSHRSDDVTMLVLSGPAIRG
jgi:serine phosphatase RsbU (regulator of sigma subunit)